MKNTFKYCTIAIAISTILTGCIDDEDKADSDNNNGNTYVVPIASDIAISGDSYVGSTLTGEYTFIDPNFSPRPEGTSNYDWRVDDGDQNLENDASIGNQRTLLLADSELDKSVYFCVTPEATGSSNTTGEIKCSTATAIEAGNGNKPIANNVTLDNTTPTVGNLLTGDYDYSDPEGDPEGISTFRWTQDGNDISAATQQTLMLTNQQEAKTIEFCVTPVSTNPDSIDNSPLIGDEACSLATDPALPLAGDAPTATKPAITGAHTVGSTLTANYTYDDANGDLESNSTFSWTSNAVEVSTTKTYTLQGSDVGKTIIFTVTPIAGTGTPTNGAPVPSDPITDVTAPVGDVPAIVLNSIDKGGVTYPEVGHILGGSYAYTASSSSSPDNSTAVWKADNVVISGVTCTTGSQCDLTLAADHYNKSLTYCVTPKAVDSPTGVEDCSAAETVYGVVLSGTLEFGKELNLTVSGYNNPTIEWQIDVSDIEGPTNNNNNPTTRNLVTTGDAAKTFLIGDEVFKQIIDADNAIDYDTNGGNANGIVDDADWAQAALADTVDMNTINASHYVGKDVEVQITFTESGVAPVTLLASETSDVTGGIYYDKTNATKRGIEPVREVSFGNAMFHRPLSYAETLLKDAVGFNANIPDSSNRYISTSTYNGIQYSKFEMVDADDYTSLTLTKPRPALDVCFNMYTDNTDLNGDYIWNLPIGKTLAENTDYYYNVFAVDGNKPPEDDTAKGFNFTKLANILKQSDNSITSDTIGLIGSYFAEATGKLAYQTSPTTGWLLASNVQFWSASNKISLQDTYSTVNQKDRKTNTIALFAPGSTWDKPYNTPLFVSCVRAK